MSRKKVYATLGALLLTGILFVLMFQEKLIFFPAKLDSAFRYNFTGSSEIYFDFESKKINSLLFTQKNAKHLILYFHGNAGSLENWGHVASEISAQCKDHVWIIDYPGYGKSEGSIRSEKQLLDLTEKFFEEAKKKFPSIQIVVYGRSIGSGPAAWLAAQKNLPLILETPYASFSQLASELAPWFPSFLRRYSFETSQWLDKFSNPLLILHGGRDEVIPVAHGKQISKNVKNSRFVHIQNGTHNDLSTYKEYWAALRVFLSESI